MSTGTTVRPGAAAPGPSAPGPSAPGPAAPGPAAPGPARPGARPIEVLRRRLEGTPGRLRLAAAAAVLACLVFALLGGYAFTAWGSALSDARSDAAQLVRVQTIQNDLVAADAAAANEYLSAGTSDVQQRTAAQRTKYDTAFAEASQLVPRAAAGNTGDAALLAAVDEAMTRYSRLVEQARANNRQGFQVGAAYLRQAGEVLRKEMVPALESVAAANRHRVADAYTAGNRASAYLAGAGVVVLVGLVVAQLWLARRTHRIINVPLVAATVGVVVALVAGAFALSAASATATSVGQSSYAATVALAQARTAAFDAKSQESLGLIARGGSTAPKTAYDNDLAVAAAALQVAQSAGARPGVATALTSWSGVHDKVTKADSGNQWSAARDLATDLQATSSNAVFDAFATSSADELDRQAATVASDLSSSGTALVVLGWLTLLLGLFAAGAAWFGISQRLGEYR